MIDGQDGNAPGAPGIPPRWTSSAKSGIGTALGHDSQLWFTLSHGVLNELFYPRIDCACTRDMGLIVSNGRDFLSEEKRHATSTVDTLAPGVPVYQLENRCLEGRYLIQKTIVTHPRRPALLQRTRFTALVGARSDYQLYALLAPHLANHGSDNTAWLGEYKGTPMLFAERDGIALAFACSVPWKQRTVGFVGASDGWQDLAAHHKLTMSYARAEHGNVALTGEIALPDGDECFELAIAFGTTTAEAGHHARAALNDGFDATAELYAQAWSDWQETLHPLDLPTAAGVRNYYRVSTMVLRAHASTDFAGGMIASLSVPWGFSKGDNDLGGYHLVWPRDLVQSAGGFLAAGGHAGGRRVLEYLQGTQEADGHWAQNMWLDGTPYWNGIQMDETALPILLLDLAYRHEALSQAERSRFWPMVRRAAGYIVRNGPVSEQDRWEEDAGFSPFTVSAQIAALLVAAELAEAHGEAALAPFLRETADAWCASIDRWMYATDTALSQACDVPGYYVRIAPIDIDDGVPQLQETIAVRNVTPELTERQAWEVVSPDAFALVRFGLRSADDPRIVATAKVIDRTLRTDTPVGPMWHRYSGDGYGEHADGSPFDGTGIGRAWPLLTGERGHLAVAAGRMEEARHLLETMERLANDGGLLPEQSWDAPDIPARELYFGRPSGSAMPLVWAHAEYLKLLRSLRDGAVFDLPPQTVQRYLVERTDSPRRIWRFAERSRTLPAGKLLRIGTLAPAVVHWSADGWQSISDSFTIDSGLGVHYIDLPTSHLPVGAAISFTFHWSDADRWEGTDFHVVVEPADSPEGA